ncbi:hypothetical protein DB88DRAFT_518740 [Papiliotrema laurentii]|uniref:Uncharacterized protein n=1 Tax=Papiliotrema laurentii TaxID=5418 RepID=A0AAD9CVH5_PAPLA|nr:hypothetical protein DB88DRAFT_518740 [Papiliotrema laurentii]
MTDAHYSSEAVLTPMPFQDSSPSSTDIFELPQPPRYETGEPSDFGHYRSGLLKMSDISEEPQRDMYYLIAREWTRADHTSLDRKGSGDWAWPLRSLQDFKYAWQVGEDQRPELSPSYDRGISKALQHFYSGSKSGFSVAPDGSEMQVCEDALQAAGVIKDGFDAGGTIDITQSESIVPQLKPVRCRYQWQSLDGHALSEAGKQTLTDELGEWQEFVKKKYGAVLDARGRDSFHSTQGGFDSRIDNPVLAPCCQKRSQGYILTLSQDDPPKTSSPPTYETCDSPAPSTFATIALYRTVVSSGSFANSEDFLPFNLSKKNPDCVVLASALHCTEGKPVGDYKHNQEVSRLIEEFLREKCGFDEETLAGRSMHLTVAGGSGQPISPVPLTLEEISAFICREKLEKDKEDVKGPLAGKITLHGKDVHFKWSLLSNKTFEQTTGSELKDFIKEPKVTAQET